jgi:serine/threonine protein phosphatase PrpC/phage FluMu protein Com
MKKYNFCGSSQIGKSHELDGSVCQDSYCIQDGENFIAAAVADGLGTSIYSDIASNKAASEAVGYCVENINTKMTDEQILEVINNAFKNANNSIKKEAGDNIDDYDTTLTLAVFIEGDLFYGHAGDSGIIALCTDGLFTEVTKPQLGEGDNNERPVYPLINESHWVFGKFDKPTHAIFLMTDGMLNMTIPPLLEEQIYKMDHAYLYYLYDEVKGNNNLDDWINDELLQLSPSSVSYDDKTLIVVKCNTVDMTHQPDEYYEYPSEEFYKSLLRDKEKTPVPITSRRSIYEDLKAMGIKTWLMNHKTVALIAACIVLCVIATPVLLMTFINTGPQEIDGYVLVWDPITGREIHVPVELLPEDFESLTQEEQDDVIAEMDREVIEELIEEQEHIRISSSPTPRQSPEATPPVTTAITSCNHTPGVAATCTTPQRCTVCNEELAAAKGHSQGAAATCTTAQRCSDCNTVLASATGHARGAAATCTRPQSCSVCNEELTAAQGHTPGAAAT